MKGAASVPAASRGKRHIVVDTLGLLLVVMVTAASVTDRESGQTLLARLPRTVLAHHAGLGRRRLHRAPDR
ncbi:transposase [Kitasatospora sp. NPDC018058]|uniref:transposase n=1 Tax=Kitasatospora sp. NPDC018058 TaxID=3364025 RepID=UPI0037BF2A51